MTFDDRLSWLMVGCLIGFTLGYIVRTFHEFHEETHHLTKTKNEYGFVRYPIVMDVALLTVVVLTIWAAFASQAASNDAEKNQKEIARVSYCNHIFLEKTIKALHARTDYSNTAIDSNVELQKAQEKFLRVAFREPSNPKVVNAAVQEYLDSLAVFIAASEAFINFEAYPTNEEFLDCLTAKKG